MSGKSKTIAKEVEAVKPGPMTKDEATKILIILKSFEENPKCLEFIDPVDFIGMIYMTKFLTNIKNICFTC